MASASSPDKSVLNPSSSSVEQEAGVLAQHRHYQSSFQLTIKMYMRVQLLLTFLLRAFPPPGQGSEFHRLMMDPPAVHILPN